MAVCVYVVDLTGKCNCCSRNVIQAGVFTFSKCDICGVEFTAGHDIAGNHYGTCGSVVTCVVNGQSQYGLVTHFFSHSCIQNTGLYAYIHWLKKTDYPFEGTPLVVRIRDDAPAVSNSPQQIVSVFDIDPSRVIVDRSNTEHCYYMCRIEGLDTIRSVQL